jgi:hypothetical protein
MDEVSERLLTHVAALIALACVALAGCDYASDVAIVPDLDPDVDLAPVPSMDLKTCEPRGAEDCFNGTDDDCNGHVDCDDTACAPVGECVPEAQGFRIGLSVAAGAACPASHPRGTALHQGLRSHAGEACAGCACTGKIRCQARLGHFSDPACTTLDGQGPIIDNESCQSTHWNGSAVTYQFSSLPVTQGGTDYLHAVPRCEPVAGMAPTKPPATWDHAAMFCQAAAHGEGCAAGQVCVPKGSGKRCALAAGDLSCSSGYAVEGAGPPWFTGLDDSGRGCSPASCGCAPPGVGDGDCNPTYARFFIYSSADSTCSQSPQANTLAANGAVQCFPTTTGPYNLASLRWAGGRAPNPPSACAPSNVVAGAAVGVGPHTLCCR